MAAEFGRLRTADSVCSNKRGESAQTVSRLPTRPGSSGKRNRKRTDGRPSNKNSRLPLPTNVYTSPLKKFQFIISYNNISYGAY